MRVDLSKKYAEYQSKNKTTGLDFAAARARMAQVQAEQASQSDATAWPTEAPETVQQSFKQRLESITNRIAGFTGGNKLAQGLGQGLAMAGTKNTLDEIQKNEGEMQTKLIEAIRKNKKEGRDTSRLEASLKALTGGITETGTGAEGLLNPNKLTGKQVIGDALQLGTTVGTLGSLPGAARGVAQQGVVKSALAGAKSGAKLGTATGGLTGLSQGLKSDKSVVDSLKQAGAGALGGAVTGGLVGGVLGGASGAISKYTSRKKLVATQVKDGMRPNLSQTVVEKSATNPAFKVMVKEAQKQGFNESDINFLATISKQDKPVMKKMFDLTVKAQSDPRQITRAGDILGENVTNQVKQVVALNKQAGKAVDVAAKALRGQEIDVSKLQQKVINELSDLDIGISARGKLDFSQSVFKNTPAVQKEIQKVISSIPDGSDAYQMHIFKKSIDELVDFGTAGEGLKGRSANLLKGLRNSADDILDTTFDDYNAANTSFKQTRDYIDAAKELVGKKVDLSSREGSQAFGQALRSAFSNNKSRPNTLKFIEDTHLLSKQLGLSGKEKNLLDQALYVNMLEETFGSEAATGLAGEVSKAISKVQRGIDVVRNPVSGGLNVVADVIEKSRNITPEAKKKILRAFLQ